MSETSPSGVEAPEIAREQEIKQKIQDLLKCSIDITEDDLLPEERLKEVKPYQEKPLHEARRKELERVINQADDILETKLEEGKGSVRSTIAETFKGGRIEKPTTDKYFEIIPKEDGGRLLMLTDLHGDQVALEKALEEFYKDDKVQIAVLGDMVAGGKGNDMKLTEALLKLYTDNPDRVHLLRGNCESGIFPEESTELYGKYGQTAHHQVKPLMQRLFRRLPAGLITENGVVGVHGSLPKSKGEEYSNLNDIQESGNYMGQLSFPVRVKSINELDELSKNLNRKAGEVYSMLWGDYNPEEEEGYEGARPRYVAGNKDIREQLKAVGGQIMFRGHQSALLKKVGKNVHIGPENNIATFHSSAKGGPNRAIVEIPLDKDIEEITEDMFREL